MANRKVYTIVLFIFAFNLIVSGTNELDIWDGDMDSYGTNIDTINASVTELTDVADIEQTEEIGIDYFAIPGMVAKSFAILVLSLAAVPLVGGLMYAYGVPLEICAIFQSLDILLMAYLYIEFTTNRSASR